jgi:hypothetical protein
MDSIRIAVVMLALGGCMSYPPAAGKEAERRAAGY